jgi:hypothetical protein
LNVKGYSESALSEDEAAAWCVIVAPFKEDAEKEGVKINYSRALIPDGDSRYKFTMCRRYRTTFSGSSGTRGIIKMCRPCSSHFPAFECGYSAAGASAPTASSQGTDNQWPQATDNGRGKLYAGETYRIIGRGLKVKALSSEEDTAGVFLGGVGPATSIQTAVSTWSTYATHTDKAFRTSETVKDGITVRDLGPSFASGYGGQLATWATVADDAAYGNTNVNSPWVYFDGIESGTVLLIQAVEFIEVSVTPMASAIPCQPSPYSPRWQQIAAAAGNPELVPPVVTGNSFKTMLRTVGKGAMALARPIAEFAVGLVPGGNEALSAYQLASQAYRMAASGEAKKPKKLTRAQRRRVLLNAARAV